MEIKNLITFMTQLVFVAHIYKNFCFSFVTGKLKYLIGFRYYFMTKSLKNCKHFQHQHQHKQQTKSSF